MGRLQALCRWCCRATLAMRAACAPLGPAGGQEGVVRGSGRGVACSAPQALHRGRVARRGGTCCRGGPCLGRGGRRESGRAGSPLLECASPPKLLAKPSLLQVLAHFVPNSAPHSAFRLWRALCAAAAQDAACPGGRGALLALLCAAPEPLMWQPAMALAAALVGACQDVFELDLPVLVSHAGGATTITVEEIKLGATGALRPAPAALRACVSSGAVVDMARCTCPLPAPVAGNASWPPLAGLSLWRMPWQWRGREGGERQARALPEAAFAPDRHVVASLPTLDAPQAWAAPRCSWGAWCA